MRVEYFILYRRKLSILYSLLLELPPHLRRRAEKIIDKWRRERISYEQTLNQILLLGEEQEKSDILVMW